MNLQSIFGSVAIGKDTSGNFKQSIYGIAVKNAEGKFIARHSREKGHRRSEGGGDEEENSPDFMDVTDLTLDATEGLFYRMPVKMEDLKPNDIIIRSDNPFSVLFVEEVRSDSVRGFDPSSNQMQTYKPLANMLDIKFLIRIVGPGNLLDDNDSNELLPLLLAGNQGAGGQNDSLSSLLLLKALGSGKTDDKMLRTLMLLGNNNNAGNNLLPLLLSLKGEGLFK